MYKFLIIVLFNCSVTISAQTVKIDESTAEVAFVFVDDDVDGTISDLTFTGNINLDKLANSQFNGSVATETIDTDNWLRNRHLRNKYFKYKDFPRLSFKSTEIRGDGKEFIVRGTLTIRGITKPVTFTFAKRPSSFYATTMINAADFDINIHEEKERNMVQIMITLPYTTN